MLLNGLLQSVGVLVAIFFVMLLFHGEGVRDIQPVVVVRGEVRGLLGNALTHHLVGESRSVELFFARGEAVGLEHFHVVVGILLAVRTVGHQVLRRNLL